MDLSEYSLWMFEEAIKGGSRKHHPPPPVFFSIWTAAQPSENVPHRIMALRNQGRNGKKNSRKKWNENRQEKNRLRCLGVICFCFCFVSRKRTRENVIRKVNNSRAQLLNQPWGAFKRSICNVYFGTFSWPNNHGTY